MQFQAVAALRGIAVRPEFRLDIVRSGGLEPLILASQCDNVEIQREVAACLCNLALNEENKVQISRSGCLPALIQLCQSGDYERERYAIAAIANIAEMVEGRTQRRMLDEGIMKPLLQLASSPLLDIRVSVARALALFASKRDSHADILQNGGLQQLVAFLRSNDEKTKRFGALGVANLGLYSSNHYELIESGE